MDNGGRTSPNRKGAKLKKLVILGIILVAANVADILLTWSLLNGGLGIEGNPIMAFVLAGGFWKSVVLKVLIPLEIALVLVRKRRLASLAILATGFLGICIWNATWIIV
jgi:hypothetical protein